MNNEFKPTHQFEARFKRKRDDEQYRNILLIVDYYLRLYQEIFCHAQTGFYKFEMRIGHRWEWNMKEINEFTFWVYVQATSRPRLSKVNQKSSDDKLFDDESSDDENLEKRHSDKKLLSELKWTMSQIDHEILDRRYCSIQFVDIDKLISLKD